MKGAVAKLSILVLQRLSFVGLVVQHLSWFDDFPDLAGLLDFCATQKSLAFFAMVLGYAVFW
jgi:hypothetical protein